MLPGRRPHSVPQGISAFRRAIHAFRIVSWGAVALAVDGVMRSRHQPRLRPAPRSAFAGYRFPPEVITLAVRWYLRFGLSYRDVEELLAGRGIEVDYFTVYRWVHRFVPELAEAARARRTWSEIAGTST
jgi:hypothetical protein